MRDDASQCLHELLTNWLQRLKPPATLESLVDVVGGRVIRNQVLAEQIKREHGDFPSIKGNNACVFKNKTDTIGIRCLDQERCLDVRLLPLQS